MALSLRLFLKKIGRKRGAVRVLLIILNEAGKGTYQRASNFGRVLAARGHEVTLIATSSHARWRIREHQVEGVRLIETPDWLAGSLRSGWDVWNTLRRMGWVHGKRYDIVHAFESRPTVLFPAAAARQRGARLIRDWADWFGRGGSAEERRNPLVRGMVRVADTFFEERFRRYGDATLTINSFLRQRAIELGVPSETITVIPNGCDTRLEPFTRAAARQAVGLPDQAPLIGYVGGIYPSDAELMAAAFNRVQGAFPDARLVLVGYFNREIEPLVAEPGRIIRSGRVGNTQMFQYLAACDVCWLPLRDNGANRGRWPGKLNDYMTMARPVVATAIGDVAEVVRRYACGLLASDEADDFARQTLALLANPSEGMALGRAARRAAEEAFSWEHMTDRLESLYRQTACVAH